MNTLQKFSLIALLVSLITLALNVANASAFIAVVNGEEIESQFYHFFSVEIFDDYGCHDTNCVPEFSHQEIIFKFWMSENMVGTSPKDNPQWVGQLHIGYDVETDVYFIEEIVDVRDEICDIEGNCWEWQEVTSELTVFANEMIWLLNAHQPITSEVKPIMFDGYQYPEMLQGENLEIINDYITDYQNLSEVVYVAGYHNTDTIKTWFAMVNNNDEASITVKRDTVDSEWYCAGLDNISPDSNYTKVITEWCEGQADTLNFVENAEYTTFLPLVIK